MTIDHKEADAAAEASVRGSHKVTRITHKKRGTTYNVVGFGSIQCDKPLIDYDEVVIYQHPETKQLWVRPTSELHDGRFEIEKKIEQP